MVVVAFAGSYWRSRARDGDVEGEADNLGEWAASAMCLGGVVETGAPGLPILGCPAGETSDRASLV